MNRYNFAARAARWSATHLLDVTNPGVWMAHCHIAEHHESGMMCSFKVAPADGHSIESK